MVSREDAPYSDRAINILTVLWGYLAKKFDALEKSRSDTETGAG